MKEPEPLPVVLVMAAVLAVWKWVPGFREPLYVVIGLVICAFLWFIERWLAQLAQSAASVQKRD